MTEWLNHYDMGEAFSTSMNSRSLAAAAKPDAQIVPAAGLLAGLARFAAGVRLADAPEIAQRQAKLCILDTIGCIVAGSQVEEVRLLLRSELNRNAHAESSVLCFNTKLSIEAATRVNGYAGDVFELNDLIAGHASIGNVTAALALAEATQASGTALLEAVITGIEVTARVYSAYYPTLKPYTEAGMAPVGFPNTIGVAAGAAKLLGLDEKRTANAMANAGALAGWCPAEVIFGNGGTVKPMLFGSWPGTVGIMAAMYARDGIDGPPRLLESDIGYYAMASRRSEPNVVLDRDTWYLSQPRRKLHACCGYIHAALDAIVAMRHEGVQFQDAAQIRIGMPEYIIPGVSKGRPPVSPNEARFHAEYCLALAACGVDVIAPEHSMKFGTFMDRPDVGAMMRKFKIVADTKLSHYHHCSVSVVDGAGSVLRNGGIVAPKGSPGNPMSDEEVRAKFRRLVSHKQSPQQTDDYLRNLQGLEKAGNWSWLVNAFDRN
jgi:2-methylcitrate dehydratase PrpD